jgi:hypothetical protein
LNFITHVVIAIAIVLIGGFVSSQAAGDAAGAMHLSYGIAALLAQGELFFAALYLRSRSETRFDMTVAAETLVALGVFSLITGIVLAVIAAPNLYLAAGNGTPRDFEPILVPFAEGLFASAVAPLLATLLRQIEVLKYAPHSETGPSAEQWSRLKRHADSAAKALSQLRIEAEAATKNMTSLADGTKSIVDSFNDIGKNIENAKAIIPTALSVAAKEIGGSGRVVTAAFETAADNIRASGSRVSTAFAATSSALDDFATEVTSSAETTKQMAGELERLSKGAEATTGILNRLHQLIDSVTNFIRPEKS